MEPWALSSLIQALGRPEWFTSFSPDGVAALEFDHSARKAAWKLRANVFVKDMQTFSFCLQPPVLTSPYYFSRLRPGLVYLVCEYCDDTPCAVWPWWRRHWPNPAFGEGDESESQIEVLPVSSLSSVCTFQRMRKGQTRQKTATSARHSKTNQWNGVVISLDN